MKRAIITLIHKDEETKHLQNWGPISLLCVDYKILTKILAIRLKEILKKKKQFQKNKIVEYLIESFFRTYSK